MGVIEGCNTGVAYSKAPYAQLSPYHILQVQEFVKDNIVQVRGTNENV